MTDAIPAALCMGSTTVTPGVRLLCCLLPVTGDVFSVTAGVVAARCPGPGQGMDWIAWLGGPLKVGPRDQRGEAPFSIGPRGTWRQLLTPGPQRRDALAASAPIPGAWSEYFTCLLS